MASIDALKYVREALSKGRVSAEGLRSLLAEIEEGKKSEGSGWRDECWSFDQLPNVLPRFVLGGLVPERALTLIPSPSYNCKTWLAVAMGKAASEGTSLWTFEGPDKAVPVIYHVPEMNAALFRSYMAKVGVKNSEDFLVRPMEQKLWSLSDARMKRSAADRLVVLDTAGYFNPADDVANYQQSLEFALLVHELMSQDGAVAVVALHHPPKYSTQDKDHKMDWTLENSVLGSAGYGGILRSCLRTANLKEDKNDGNPWVYVQGLKNPGLKPFQLEGIPLRMKVPPGESPYLRHLLGDSDFQMVSPLFAQKLTNKVIAKRTGFSSGKVSSLFQRWKAEHEEKTSEAKHDQDNIDFEEGSPCPH